MGKGSQFERDICRKLSLWWTDGARDDIFWRTSQSGGRATTRAKAGKALQAKGAYGDIAAIDPVGEPLIAAVSIEVKRGYNRFSLQDLMDGTQAEEKYGLASFLDQARRDAAASNREWLLIWKRDRRTALIFYTRAVLNKLESLGLAWGQFPADVRVCTLWDFATQQEVVVAPLDAFLGNFNRAGFERLVSGMLEKVAADTGETLGAQAGLMGWMRMGKGDTDETGTTPAV